jgi:predicted nucleic acid-binding protein
MNLYLDASALVKRYVAEEGSTVVRNAVSRAAFTSTAVISRAEVSAALAKAVRAGILAPAAARACLDAFRRDWPSLLRIQVSEIIVARADALAWKHGLRGYDAVQLACAAAWQDSFGSPITLATYDKPLWLAASTEGLTPFPARL